MASNESILQGVTVLGSIQESQRKILTPQALTFLALLQRSFNPTRKALLERRKIRQAELDKGALPDFLPETKHIRDDPTWKGAAPAPGLVDRRVEITGPTDRKMVVNALNADVWTYMADFECKPCHVIIPFCGFSRLIVYLTCPRLERPHVGQHGQRPGQPLRCRPPPGRL